MKMSQLEKKFVNSKKHAAENQRILEGMFVRIDLSGIREALEIGCGVGFLSAYLNEKYGMKVTGTDVDPEQIELARKHHEENEHLRFLEADATKLPFEDTEFDMVLSFKVLHHIGSWDRALEEIHRVLRPKGYYVFNDIACSNMTVKFLRPLVKYHGVYRAKDISRFLEGRNFEIVHKEKPKGMLFQHHSLLFKKN